MRPRLVVPASMGLLCLLAAQSCRFGYEEVPFGLGAGGDDLGSGSGGGPRGVGLDAGSGGSTVGGTQGAGASMGSGGQQTATGAQPGLGGGVNGSGGASGGTSPSLGGEGGEGMAGAGSQAGGGADYCAQLPHLAGVPTIDGQLDGQLPLELLGREFFRVPDDNPVEFSMLPAEVSARFAVGWHETGLYFYAEVVDPDRYPAAPGDNEWEGDGIELYVDHDATSAGPGLFDFQGTRAFSIAAPPDDATDSERAGVFMPFVALGDLNPSNYRGVPTAEGYVVEAWIDAASLGLSAWSLQAGAPVSFDLGHNVSFPAGEVGSEGYRLGHYFLQVLESGPGAYDDYPFYNSEVYCQPTLEP